MHKHPIIKIVSILLVVLCLILTYLTISSHIFNQTYVLTALALLWVLALISILASLHSLNKIKVMGEVLVVVMLLVTSFSSFLMYNLDKSMYKIKQNDDAIIYSIYTNNQESDSLKLGLIKLGNRIYENNILDVVKKDYPKIEILNYQSIDDVVNDLNAHVIDGILCLDSYYQIMLKDYVLEDEYHALKHYKYESERNLNSKAIEGSYSILLTTSNALIDHAELSPSMINKIMIINPDSAKIGVINMPYNYYLPQLCLNNNYDIVSNMNLYSLSCGVGTLTNTFDSEINYYLRINLAKLANLINDLGGLDIDNPQEYVGKLRIYPKGSVELSGEEMLDYLSPSGDYSNYLRESVILDAAINKIDNLRIIRCLSRLGDIFETNLDNDKIIDLLEGGFEVSSFELQGVDGYGKIESYGNFNQVKSIGLTEIEDVKAFIEKIKH